jgi:hypothetical protein
MQEKEVTVSFNFGDGNDVNNIIDKINKDYTTEELNHYRKVFNTGTKDEMVQVWEEIKNKKLNHTEPKDIFMDWYTNDCNIEALPDILQSYDQVIKN